MSDAATAMRETTRPKASKTGAEAKENYERMKAATDEITDMVEASYSSAVKGARDYGLKVIDMTRVNASAAFDLCGKLVAVKSPSEAIELSTTHARQQFDAVSTQSKELWALAQKVATDVAEPIKTGISKALQGNA